MATDQARNAAKLHGVLEKRLNSLIDGGFELGAQVAVYQHGELIADVAVGRVSSKSDRKVDSNTLFPVCSTGKGILATMVHILAERGVIDYDCPVSRYWPEFAVNGKAAITVRQAMSHLAGIPVDPGFGSLDEICDFDAACAKIAQLTPIYPPGSEMQYHSRTFGWIVGGFTQRAAGRTVGQLLVEEVTRPLGVERGIFFGTDDEAETRVSPFEAQPSQKEQVTTAANTYDAPPEEAIDVMKAPLMDFVNIPQVRRSCMPAVNGIMSAKAIAKVNASLMGEVEGVRLLSESQLEKATTGQTPIGGTPECFGHSYGLGYGLKGPLNDMGAFFGHGGAGGSEGMANRRLGLAIGVTKNRMDTHIDAPDHTNRIIMRGIRALFGDEGDGGFYLQR